MPKKILVVDDSPSQIVYVSEILSQQGYEVFSAKNGESGIQSAETKQPDLILMDVVMPGINGYQATRKLSKNTLTQHIPVIVCTNKGEETDKAWGMRQGAADYLVKPFDAESLLVSVKALLK